MTALFKKLNFKNQCPIFILDSPESFAGELKAMAACTTVKTSFEEKDVANFVLAFATRQAEVDAFANLFSEKTAGDAIAWIAYPKGSSKRFRCDFNRDTGWQLWATTVSNPFGRRQLMPTGLPCVSGASVSSKR